jgi:putative DNA primase/helicase
MGLLQEAVAWYVAGYMPLPTKVDGSKAPAVTTWTQFQKERPSLAEVIELFQIDSDGLGLLCGEISGGLEMLELEGRAMAEGYMPRLEQAFLDHDMGMLLNRIANGYVERTPSGGIHFYYRVQGYSKRNTKLARRPATPDELTINPDEKLKVLIETRAEGGFTVIAPSAGRTHSSGAAWTPLVTLHDPRSVIPVITEDERDAIHAICSTLDQVPVSEPPPPSRGNLSLATDNELRPGDDFNLRATWKEILEPHGWTCHKHYGGNLYGWRKPGKTHPGISATTGRNDEDRLYVFSTSTDFDAERPYSKFSAYALLEHSGDFGAAARALRAMGYGERTAPAAAPRSRSEQLEHLVLGVVRADSMVRKAHLHWTACQVLRSYPPSCLELLRQAGQRVGISDADIEQIFIDAKHVIKNGAKR